MSSYPNRESIDDSLLFEEHSFEIEQRLDTEFENRLISKEIEENPHSSRDLVAKSNYRQMRLRNRRQSEAARSANTCLAMCT